MIEVLKDVLVGTVWILFLLGIIGLLLGFFFLLKYHFWIAAIPAGLVVIGMIGRAIRSDSL